MSSSERATAARLSADPVAREARRSAGRAVRRARPRRRCGPLPARSPPAARGGASAGRCPQRRRPHGAAALGAAGTDGASRPGCGPRDPDGLCAGSHARPVGDPRPAGRPLGCRSLGVSTWPGAPSSVRPLPRPPGLPSALLPVRSGRAACSAGSPCGAPAPTASTSPGAARRVPPRSRSATAPWCCARCPALPHDPDPPDPAHSDFPRCGAASPRSGVDRIAVDAAGPPWSSGRPRHKTERTA